MIRPVDGIDDECVDSLNFVCELIRDADPLFMHVGEKDGGATCDLNGGSSVTFKDDSGFFVVGLDNCLFNGVENVDGEIATAV